MLQAVNTVMDAILRISNLPHTGNFSAERANIYQLITLLWIDWTRIRRVSASRAVSANGGAYDISQSTSLSTISRLMFVMAQDRIKLYHAKAVHSKLYATTTKLEVLRAVNRLLVPPR